MKTNKTIAVLLFFLITNSLLAQEKQNDATLEETKRWIYQQAIPNNINTKDNCLGWYVLKNYYFNEKRNELSFRYINYNGEEESTIYVNKENIEKLYLYKKSKGYSINFKRNDSNDNCLQIYFRDEDFALRVFKAFEHLFYLLDWNVEILNTVVDKNKF